MWNFIKFIVKAIIVTIIAIIVLGLIFGGKGNTTQTQTKAEQPAPKQNRMKIPAEYSSEIQIAAYCAGVFEGAKRIDNPKYAKQWDDKSFQLMMIAANKAGGVNKEMENASFHGIQHVLDDKSITTVVMTCALMFPAK